MNAKQPTITYDPKSRILSIRTSTARSVDSDVHGNVVVDYDAQGNTVNIDIMECSLDEFRRVPPMRRYVRTHPHRSVARRRAFA